MENDTAVQNAAGSVEQAAGAAAAPAGADQPAASAPATAESAPADAVAPADPVAEAVRAAEAAEHVAEKAADLAARRAEQAARAAEAAESAVGEIGATAGFVTRAGAYYDVKVARVAAADADAARAAADRALDEADAARAAADRALDEADAARVAASAPADAPEPAAPAAPAGVPDPDAAEAAEAEAGYVDPAVFSRQVARLTEAVARQPLHREILYKVLVFCQETRGLQEVEAYVAGLPAFKHAANNPYHFIDVLEQAGGLERLELDDEGDLVTPERKAGLTDDEVDDLVASYAFMTTPAGMAVVEQHTPRARIVELLGLVPERKDAYIELMEFVADEPRTYNEVSQLFKGRDVLVRMVDGEPQVMQPSVFVDKLEAAGGVEWNDGWVLTEEGRAFLAELHEL